MRIEDEIRHIHDRIAAAQRQRARAEHDREIALTQAQQASDALRNEFGVSTVEEAKTRHAELTAQLAEALASVEAALVEIEAST